jgi:hypothetical protein
MTLAELFEGNGLGVMATAGADGAVNTAIYARPHVLNETTLVWGMTEGRSFRNLAQTPKAAFLFKMDKPGYQGVRLALELIRTEETGEMLETIKRRVGEVVGAGAGPAVTHAAWFRVTEVRKLV